MWTPRQDTVDEAYRVVDQFPGTWAADQAERFLASLGSPVRSPPERFWQRFWRPGIAAAVAIPALAALYVLYRWWVCYRRAARLACARCGYDLRGTKDSARCPECGTPASPPTSSATTA
jgi:hypothetical protein